MKKFGCSRRNETEKELVRITRSKEGEVALDPTGKLPGRGAYVDLDPAEVQKLGIKIRSCLRNKIK